MGRDRKNGYHHSIPFIVLTYWLAVGVVAESYFLPVSKHLS